MQRGGRTAQSSNDQDAVLKDVASVWLEKTMLRVEDSFPTVLRRSEIAEVDVIKISPIENAIATVESKSQELDTLRIKFVKLGQVMDRNAATPGGMNTNRLSMVLNSAVDAPMSGGIPTYRKVFFSTQYVSHHPEEEALLSNLREAIDRQAGIIHQCLLLHSQLCPLEMRPFHATLIRFFKQNFADEISRLDLPIEAIPEQAESSRAYSQDGQEVAIFSDKLDARPSNSVVSPLQRHIAFLSQQQSQPMGSAARSTEQGKLASAPGTAGHALGTQTVPPILPVDIPSSVLAATGSSAATTGPDAGHLRKSSGVDNQSMTSKAQGSILSKMTEGGRSRASKMFGRRK